MNSILIGKIVNVHGIKGEIKIYPYTDEIDNLCSLKELYFDKELKDMQKVSYIKSHKNMLIAKLVGVDTIDIAQTFKDRSIYIFKKDIDEIDTYYIEDLIGLDVFDLNNEYIGKLTYVFNTLANDVYEVHTKADKLIYLPAILQVIKKVDIFSGKMYVEIMDGLL